MSTFLGLACCFAVVAFGWARPIAFFVGDPLGEFLDQWPERGRC